MEEACRRALAEACDETLSHLEAASEALGKGRGSGSGLARILSRAAEALERAVGECIRGCWELEAVEARCIVGETLERVKNSLQGVALRLARLGKLEGESEELASMLVDLAYALIEGICKSYLHQTRYGH